MNAVPPIGYALLAAILVASILLDHACVRAATLLLRPTSAYVFWAARAGKLAAVGLFGGLLIYFWAPNFMPAMTANAGLFNGVLAAVLGVMLLIAGVSAPRAPRSLRSRNA